jgi:UDP-N-acetylmuramoyl-tripeptide--D-alanyl-D-alanine ligase
MSLTVLWTAQEAVQATGGRSAAAWTASGVSIDSRSLAPGDLFIALAGPNFDGHDFLAKAFAKGAAAAMVHRAPEGGDSGPLLMVDDTMSALSRLGAAARTRSGARFVGITGSAGKTGTKEALAQCLAAQAPTSANAGSLNNHWGLPLSLARLPRDAVYGVFELGMNHAGEIRELTRLLRPEVAMITNIEPAHIGHFGSLEAIADAKAEIFEFTAADGAAVLNRDNPMFERLADRAREAGIARILGFGRHAESQARLIEIDLRPAESRVRAEVDGRSLDYTIGLPGFHWVMNSLAILAAAAAIGADPAAAAAELARLKAIKGRGDPHQVALPGGAFLLIDDSYNANPTSMRAAFEVLGRSEVSSHGRRIAVLGDMLELGDRWRQMHEDLAEPLEHAGIDLVFTCGDGMAALNAALPPALRAGHGEDSQALVDAVTAVAAPGDCVLVKGSAGSRMGLVVEALKALAQDLPRAANGE